VTILLDATESGDACDVLQRENALDAFILLELDKRTSAHLQAGRLELASRSAALQVDITYGAKRYEPRTGEAIAPRRVRITTPVLTIQKLRHDIEQFEYLRGRGVLGDEFGGVISRYEDLVRRLTPLGPDARVQFNPTVCLESTLWFTNRYAHGRLGAFFSVRDSVVPYCCRLLRK
jgi:hypothetical protein